MPELGDGADPVPEGSARDTGYARETCRLEELVVADVGTTTWLMDGFS